MSRSDHREVERVRCGDSVDFDGCSEAQSGVGARSHNEGSARVGSAMQLSTECVVRLAGTWRMRRR